MLLKLCAAALVLWVRTIMGAKPVVRSMSIESTGKIKDNTVRKPIVRSMKTKDGVKSADKLSMSIDPKGKVNKGNGRPVIRKVRGVKATELVSASQVKNSADFDKDRVKGLAVELQSLEERVATIENTATELVLTSQATNAPCHEFPFLLHSGTASTHLTAVL